MCRTSLTNSDRDTQEATINTALHVPLSFNPNITSPHPPAPGPSPAQYAPIKRTIWPHLNTAQWDRYPAYAKMYSAARKSCLPNRLDTKLPIPSGLNIKNWAMDLAHYHDKSLVQYLNYGWPVGYTAPHPPTNSSANHKSALAFPKQVQQFISKELSLGALLGPFTEPPFTPWTQTSPLMTAPKKDSTERRIILDLSFSEDNTSVNDGVTKNVLDGELRPYTLPSVEDLVTKALLLGPTPFMWKADMARAFRQLRSDVLDIPLLGFEFQGAYYIDACPPFGARLSSLACQRTTNAIVYILGLQGIWAVVYLDDFCGAAASYEKALRDYQAFMLLAKRLGVQLAPDKCSPPTQRLEWLGFIIDTVNFTLTIPQAKLAEIVDLCNQWALKKAATKKEIQSIVGILVHIAKCVKPARRFLARILHTLARAPDSGWMGLSAGFKADINWFSQYAVRSNGIQLLTPSRSQFHIYCDSSLEGGGGCSDNNYYHLQYDNKVKQAYPDIVHREAINLLIAYRTLIPKISVGLQIIIHTDNTGSQQALETGKTKDPILAACARQIWVEAAIRDHAFKIVHKPGRELPLSDALSRQHIPAMRKKATDLIALLETHPPPTCATTPILLCNIN